MSFLTLPPHFSLCPLDVCFDYSFWFLPPWVKHYVNMKTLVQRNCVGMCTNLSHVLLFYLLLSSSSCAIFPVKVDCNRSPACPVSCYLGAPCKNDSYSFLSAVRLSFFSLQLLFLYIIMVHDMAKIL